MKQITAIVLFLVMVFTLTSCDNKIKFTETENKSIVSTDGAEYTFVGYAGEVWSFGEWKFIGHVQGEKKSFVHLTSEIKTGMYSINDSQDILVRNWPDNDFPTIYVKSELLKTEVALDNCIRFEFVKDYFYNTEILSDGKGITDCDAFLNEIRNGQKAIDAGLYDLTKQPDGMLKNCYVYGYVCGVLQEDLNLFILLRVMSFDDKAYSIKIGNEEYVLTQKWIDKLVAK